MFNAVMHLFSPLQVFLVGAEILWFKTYAVYKAFHMQPYIALF